MRPNKKAFTLVEMLVALAVSAVIVSATYASFELIKTQYKKNIDVTQLHTSGRAIMQVLEREIRMAGYEFRDDKGLMTYGKIIGPLAINDSGNQCCDEVIIIYDEVTDILNAQGVVTSSVVDRIKTRFWTEAHFSSKRGSRFRLYKRRTILGTNNAILATPRVGAKEVMADYIEDLQLNFVLNTSLFVGINGSSNVKIINSKTGAVKGSIANTFNTSAFAFDGEGLLYAGVSANNGIRILNPSTRVITKSIGPGYVASLAFDSAGRLYVGIYQPNSIGRGEIQILDPSDGTIIGTIPNTPYSFALAFNSLGNLYIGGNGNIKIINPLTKATIGTIPNTASAFSLAFDSAGILYAGFGNRDIQVINPSTKKIIGSIPARSVEALAFDNMGLLYAGHNGGSGISVIDPSTRSIMSMIANTSNTHALAFQTKKLGNGASISIGLTLRTKNEYGKKNRQFLKKNYHSGNFNFSKNDLYQRDTFSTTVSVRNL